MYDAIVVGARCAGSSTAMLLARRGYRVLLVDRATFPSDTLSSHFIHPSGVARLRRWGVLDRLLASGCPPVPRYRFDVGPFALAGSARTPDGIDYGVAPRRTVLDKILLDAAAEAGAEVRTGFSVKELTREGERITGVRGAAGGSASVAERARIVIGADGMRSRVARAVAAPEYGAHPSLTCNYYAYWSGVPTRVAELYARDRRFMIAAPTHDGLTVVVVIAPVEEFQAFRSDVRGSYLASLGATPELAERVRQGRLEGRFLGTADLPNFFRKPYGAGWALVGDAGYHKDPITAQGISDAFRDAERLAEAVDAGLSGLCSLDQALAAYQEGRDAEHGPMYELTCQLAALQPPPPEMQQLFAALRGNPAETDRFFGTMAGTVRIPDFYAPDHVRRIVGGAGARPLRAAAAP